MKKSLLFVCCLLSSMTYAKSITISGFIEDASSKERLIGVNVFVPGTTLGTSTNTYGFYSLTVDLPDDTITIAVSYLGFNTQRFELYNGKNHKLDVALKISSEELDEAVVTAEEMQAEKVEMSTFKLTAKEIKQIPAFLGEVDVIRALQLLPGVQSGGEGSTGFYVRGGSPDQNLILLDGVPVYNASHLFGFFSVFNADAIKNVQLTKGGFPARFSGRLSSVLEIDLKEGNMKEFHGEGSVGLIASRFTLEGPLIKDKTSFIVSGRRTYYDLLVRPFLPSGTDAGYYFQDLNAKINHNISRKDRVYVSFYTGIDKFFASQKDVFSDGSEDEFSTFIKWGNYTGSARWNHLFSDKLFGNLTTSYTQYRFAVGAEERSNFNGQEENFGFEFSSLIRDYGVRYDMDYVLNANHTFKFGANYTYHIFKPGVAQIQSDFSGERVDSLLNLSTPIYSNEIVTYVEDDWKINDKLRVNYGLNYSIYAVGNTTYNSLQPRFSGRYLLRDDWSVKASYAYMNQFIHLLSNNGIGLPTDLWVSSTDRVKPQRSQQIALGTTRNIKGNMYEVSVETYYKWMNNLIAYQDGASYLSTTDWQNTVETDGDGQAYGAEFLVRKNKGKFTGWVGYTLAWTTRQFENINDGERYPYKYDRRHDISVVTNYKFSDRFDLGVVWVYGTGNTFTAPLSNYLLQDVFGPNSGSGVEPVERFSSRNGLRLPAYHRLDVGFNFHKPTKWGESTWSISAYNAYNRQNPFFLYINQNFDSNGNSSKTVNQVSLFPIIPSISYSFKF
jgi:hypothetical protein